MKRISFNVCFCTFFPLSRSINNALLSYFKNQFPNFFFQSAQGYLFSDLDDETQEFFELRAPREEGGSHLWVVVDEERRARDANFGEGGGSDVPKVKTEN